MGFFKKIGKAIKKNVNLKGVVKLASTAVAFVPAVGPLAQKGIQLAQKVVDARATAKKAQQANDYQAAHDAEMLAKSYEQEALSLSSQTVGTVANAGANILAKSVVQGVNDGLSAGFVSGTGEIGATVVSSTIKVWFQRNWKIVLGAVAGLVALIWFLRRDNGNRSTRARKR